MRFIKPQTRWPARGFISSAYYRPAINMVYWRRLIIHWPAPVRCGLLALTVAAALAVAVARAGADKTTNYLYF